jgi:hypothetical protein
VLNANITNLVAYFLKIIAYTILVNYNNKEIKNKIKYSTRAIIYKDLEITYRFSKLLNKFLDSLFNNIGFINLPKDK